MGLRGGRGTGKGHKAKGRSRWLRGRKLRLTIAAIVVLLALNFWLASSVLSPPPRVAIPYSPTFLHEVMAGNVTSITSAGDLVQGELRHAVRYPARSATAARRDFSTRLPSFLDGQSLLRLLERMGVTIDVRPAEGSAPLWASILVGFGPTILFLGLITALFRRMSGLGGGTASFGRSRARRFDGSDQPVSFADVAGIDEAKEELTEIVDFLKSPDKYRRLGGQIPRGVLLSGAPGTGKTLLARAVAGEADVPFFQMSASEFVEMIVGVGASRVRDLFAQAKAAAPAIIFVDELDAVGRSRSAGGPNASGGHDERDQTLNQILTEMDGFDSRTDVIVLGATNRPETLDIALLRPGRFDRRVVVQAPDRTGRRAILEVHTRSVPLAPEVDLNALASSTPGMVGADLANLVNEAALLAARRAHDAVSPGDLSDALERVVLGAERRLVLSEDDRRRTAYHEAGHALIGMLTPGADPVRKVSIIPRGQALGVTFSAPDDDRFNIDERHLKAQIRVSLGGRIAEEVVFGDRTTGAESDIQMLTAIARQMVGRWGMSSLGPVAFLNSDGTPPAAEYSETMQRRVDEEVLRIIDEARSDVLSLIIKHRENLDALVSRLVEHETLDELDAYAAAGLPRAARPDLDQPPITIA